jgi:molecular chaperone GrpE
MAEETSKETIAGIEPEEENLNGCEPEQQAEETAEPAEEAGKQEEEETLQQPDAPEDDVVDGIFTQEEENTEKKSFFKKKKDKRDEKIAELTDQVKRQMAEFDNFRKRSEREKSQMFDLGAKSVIEKILPVIDNFERGLAQAPDMTDPFVEGMEKIYKSMLQELEAIGVKPIEAEGKEFDPNLHNAVMHVEDDSLGENIVAQELQKGYTYHDSVVRHSMVKVAN